MKTVAIIHYTFQPAIGGVESMVSVQAEELQSLGYRVRLIGGNKPSAIVDHCRLPEMLPSATGVQRARRNLTAPEVAGHGSTRYLISKLLDELRDVDAVWVHNALTLDLHPFVREALLQVVRLLPEKRWVLWAHDISAASAFVRGGQDRRPMSLLGAMTYVVLSEVRRSELALCLGVAEERIRVVPPPVSVDQWIATSPDTSLILDVIDGLMSECTVLVPIKLLPHKNINLLVPLASAIQELSSSARILVTAAYSPHEPQLSKRIAEQLRNEARFAGCTNTLCLASSITGRTLSRQAVKELMLLSDAVLMPSVEEGFGIPIVEAQMLRVPVICSDIPVFREAAGTTASYFDVQAPAQDLAEQIMRIAAQPLNVARREACLSLHRYRQSLQTLLETC